jgi:hypothetical protein
MKRGVLLLGAALSVLTVAFTGCSKDPIKNLSQDESRIYITNHDSTTTISGYKTYSITDSVAVISNNRLQGHALTAYDAQVLSALKQAMQERGFTLVDKNAKPDLGLNVSRITNTYSGVVSYPDYWGAYGSYYDPYYWGYGGYGYYAPAYYSYGVYQINEGGLSVELLDLKNATANGNKIEPVWTALARGTGVFNTTNATSQVQAFFAQSPYLKSSL